MAHPRVGSFRARRAALTQLANRELLFQVKSLVGRERKLEVDVLFHLIEVESRRLHLDLGFPSMFQYCVDGLGYPRATAARRMKVARCLRDSSQATVLLEA